jgi:hypothetical protein
LPTAAVELARTSHIPILPYHRHTLGATLRLLSVGGPLARGPAQACSGYGGSKPPKWWDNYEASPCRHGMWVHGCGLFRISTEPEFSEFITPDRGSAVRIRTGGCGGEDPLGAELPHPLRAHHPGRPRAFGYLCTRGTSVRDRIGALGGGVRFRLTETDTEPGSCGASHDPCCAREEEDQVAARGGVGRTAISVSSASGFWWRPAASSRLAESKSVGLTSARLAVLVGEPTQAGPYVVKVKVPSGVKLDRDVSAA